MEERYCPVERRDWPTSLLLHDHVTPPPFLQVSERGEELSANVCRLDAETGVWEVETELPAKRSHHCLAVLGGFVFAAGGSSSRDDGGDAACNLLYRYDPRHGRWTRVPGGGDVLLCRPSCL